MTSPFLWRIMMDTVMFKYVFFEVKNVSINIHNIRYHNNVPIHYSKSRFSFNWLQNRSFS